MWVYGPGSATITVHDPDIREGCHKSSEHCQSTTPCTTLPAPPRNTRLRCVDLYRLRHIQNVIVQRIFLRVCTNHYVDNVHFHKS